jgi:hypothetical protein
LSNAPFGMVDFIARSCFLILYHKNVESSTVILLSEDWEKELVKIDKKMLGGLL